MQRDETARGSLQCNHECTGKNCFVGYGDGNLNRGLSQDFTSFPFDNIL